jgi:hypothetical protein
MSCMTTATHTMVMELSHEVVVSFMRWLFREAMTSFSLLALSPSHHQKSYMTLHETTYLLTCTNVLALNRLVKDLQFLTAWEKFVSNT